MYTSFGKACKIARENAGLTQEMAEPLILVGVRSISNYEGDITMPTDETVARMVQFYNAPWLGYSYLLQTNVGKMILPPMTPRNLSGSILDLQVEMDHVTKLQIEIAECGRDNLIDDHELPKWQRCMAELRELAGAIFSVRLAGNGKTAH
jgi:transcriptional regulator with XRE-family HTH domain